MNRVPQIGGFLASPLVGGVAGLLFQKEECTTIPGGTLGGYRYESREFCSSVFNSEIGMILTPIGWAICGIWLIATIWSEQQASRKGS